MISRFVKNQYNPFGHTVYAYLSKVRHQLHQPSADQPPSVRQFSAFRVPGSLVIRELCARFSLTLYSSPSPHPANRLLRTHISAPVSGRQLSSTDEQPCFPRRSEGVTFPYHPWIPICTRIPGAPTRRFRYPFLAFQRTPAPRSPCAAVVVARTARCLSIIMLRSRGWRRTLKRLLD